MEWGGGGVLACTTWWGGGGTLSHNIGGKGCVSIKVGGGAKG